MSHFHFSDAPARRHRAQGDPGADLVHVDGTAVSVQSDGAQRFMARLDGRTERLHAVADGDQVWVHWRGRAWQLQRIDPTRASTAGAQDAAGSVHAPMPGVVVSLLVAIGQDVAEGDALLVIESMKLQTTLCAAAAGTVAQLPLAHGQTFQRGALLARLQPA